MRAPPEMPEERARLIGSSKNPRLSFAIGEEEGKEEEEGNLWRLALTSSFGEEGGGRGVGLLEGR